MSDKIILAEQFATEKHQNQFRKDGTTPYISHPQAVVEILKQCGVEDPDVLAAGWLHDILEDCHCTEKEIYTIFGNKVSSLVKQLTFESEEGNNYAKDLYLAGIARSLNSDLILIKCADRIHNTRCFYESGNYNYAAKYFHKANCIFGALYMFKKAKIYSAMKMYEMVQNTEKLLKNYKR